MVCIWSIAAVVAMVMVVQMACLKTHFADSLYVSNQNQRRNITKQQNDKHLNVYKYTVIELHWWHHWNIYVLYYMMCIMGGPRKSSLGFYGTTTKSNIQERNLVTSHSHHCYLVNWRLFKLHASLTIFQQKRHTGLLCCYRKVLILQTSIIQC